jgi:phosphotriesterase-related protein
MEGMIMKKAFKVLIAVVLAVTFSAGIGFACEVMTVKGPIHSSKMGRTLIHEHIAFAYPGWYADDSVAPYNYKAVKETALKALKEVKKLGFKTMVIATPLDAGGRDPLLFRQLSVETGINIIMATGLYTEGGGSPGYYKFMSTAGGRNLEEDLYDLFKHEITVGTYGTRIKAGIIKVATSDPVITDYEKTIMRAAVRVSNELGVPIITHTDKATVGPAQIQFFKDLCADSTLDPAQYCMNFKRLMIGHQNNSDQMAYHMTQLTMDPDVYIGFDRTNPLDYPRSKANMAELAKTQTDRIMMAHDSILTWLGRPLIPGPIPWDQLYPTFISLTVIPDMKAAGVTEAQINTILINNPRRLFDGE